MRRMLSGLAVLALGTVASNTLEAQACLGLNSPTNLQLSAAAGNNAKEFGANLHFGKATGVFFGVGGHYTSFDDVGTIDGGSAKGVTGTIGAQMGAGGEKKPAFCPIAQVGYTSFDGDASSVSAAGGLSAGIPVAASSDFTIIPTASLVLVYERFSVSGNSNSDGYGILSGGAGFMISPRFVLKPFVDIPIGLEGSDPVFGVVASIGFGKGS
jgi:hypothetical protein